MIVEKTFPRMANANKRDLERIYVVVGNGERAGQIKTLYVGRHVRPSILVMEWAGFVLRRVTLRKELEDAGWFFLQEAFAAEDMEWEWAQWLEYQDAARLGQAQNLSFPEDMLPEKVRKLRDSASKGAGWKPKRRKGTGGGRTKRDSSESADNSPSGAAEA